MLPSCLYVILKFGKVYPSGGLNYRTGRRKISMICCTYRSASLAAGSTLPRPGIRVQIGRRKTG